MSGTMNTEEEEAYNQVTKVLDTAKKLAPKLTSIPTLVSLRDIVREPPVEDELPSSLLKPNQGHHALFRALEDLEKLESEVILEQDTLNKITSTVTSEPTDNDQALAALQAIGMSIPRRVCQHPFKKNDIVWVCRTCQADETCVLCHACYSHSNHQGHDVAFYHAQAGGCCDCGDPDAWDPAGFCPSHGPAAPSAGGGLDASLINRVKGIVPAAVDWLVNTIAANAETAHERAKPVKADIRKDDSTDVNESAEGDDAMAVDLEHVFVPEAASTSKSIHGSLNTSVSSDSEGPSVTQRLGADGLEGHGLYLILHADDIHTSTDLVKALREIYGGSSYFTDTLLARLVRALRQHGQLVVWGTMEVVGVCSNTHVHCWLDGDVVASSRIGSVLLEKAALLSKHGLVCSIATRKELQFEQRAVAVLHWLAELARSCDPLCQTVAESILPERHLVPMLRSDFKVSASITKAWHSLLLTLLAVPAFKSHLAAAYCDTYRYLTLEYASGLGVLERSAYTLSVQFLNRVTYVVGLVQGRDLLGKLGKALLETFQVAATSTGRLNPEHFVLTHRRYSPCISDLKCVLNVKGMARLFASSSGTFMQDWIHSLSMAQFMDGVVWRTMSQGHVETESRGWVGAFNASISLGSLFERLLSWEDTDKSPVDPSQSPLAQNLLSCVELNFHVMTQGLGQWQSTEMASYVTKYDKSSVTGEHCLCPTSLPFTTVASRNGTSLAFDALPIAQATEWSFHLPLHRFVAATLREACRRPVGQAAGVEELMNLLSTQVPEAELDSLFQGLMEFPALVLSRAAQIRAGLWRRNGSLMHDQVLNYAEPPFCRSLRDADIALLQYSVLGRRQRGEDVGCSLLVNLLLHRFGIFDFMGFAKAPNSNIRKYKEEVLSKLYKPERQTQLSIGYVEEEDIVLPWTYTAASDLTASLALLEEFLHLLIVLISELPSMPPKDNADHTAQAKQRLRREVVHRLASGPKTHSELAEVHHVCSHWDNELLSAEGKLINPDDASGAALGQALAIVAERKTSRGRLAPHHWELTRQAWDNYDPAFFHISMRNHQSASDNRPKPASTSTALGVEAKPFAPPKHIPAHPSFQRLERDITADATVLAVAYRTLHVHCTAHSGEAGRDVSGVRGSLAYHSDAMSETALSRVVHLLTLGAFAWKDASVDDKEWRKHGGGSSGSIFYSFNDETSAPTAKEWVALALMSPPDTLMDSAWYVGEENTLLLLRRLAVDGGRPGGFVSQDRALRSGAAWLCEFAANNNTDAAALIGSKEASAAEEKSNSGKSDLERRKLAAKQKAMERMKAQAAKFADQMKLESEEADSERMEESEHEEPGTPQSLAMSPRRQPMSRSSTVGSESFNSSSTAGTRSPQRSDLGIPQFFSMYSSGGDVLLDDSENEIPDRLLKERPQCIICVDDGCMATGEIETLARSGDEEGKRKRSRRKTGSNALAFVGYAQASTVQKGGGGPPPAFDDHSPVSSARRFAGTHVTLCGHAVHSECCESYLASVSHREDRSIGRRDEFGCPLCRRLSNCLVPFIDVGADWADTPKRDGDEGHKAEKKRETASTVKSTGDDDECMELDDEGQPRPDLHSFLSETPWWVARADESVVWDGQCAFISPETSDEKNEDKDGTEEMDVDDGSPQSQSSRRRVRSLRKKDLYAAWTAMMRTPRFVMRRRLRPKSSPPSDDGTPDARAVSQTIWPTPSEETSGETIVWRRLMDLVSDVAFKADGKRLGERYLHQYCGEFRHYIVEKSAYNIANREGGRSNVEWPACISMAGALPDSRRQELSREKLLAKLLMSVQAFTYSSCCESHEAKRVLQKEESPDVAGLEYEQSLGAICSKYGISGITCNGKLVLMPSPSISGSDSDGTQPFNGRLGKLRHFGLAVMAACGAVSADLVQLVMCFPLKKKASVPDDPLTAYFDSPTRAPVVFPLLLGHVLTHVVAAMCAACGRARAKSDCLELAWPAPFSRRGSFSDPLPKNEPLSVSVANDCEGFIKLGVLARVLQILLNRMDIQADRESDKRDAFVLAHVRQMLEREDTDSVVSNWLRTCFSLLEKALASNADSTDAPMPPLPEGASADLEKQYRDACSIAAIETVSFLSDVGIIFQMLVPGIVSTFQVGNASEHSESNTDLAGTLETLGKLQNCMGLEAIEDMLESSLVQEIVRNWYESARSHARTSVAEESGVYSGKIRSRLYQTEGFRCFDWPMASIKPYVKIEEPSDDNAATSMLVDSNPASIATRSKESRSTSNPLAAFSSKKSIQLLGGYAVAEGQEPTPLSQPRVATLATSYTDLYAALGTLCPDSDQTALCLLCGEVLNAGGKGECTKHSYRCGGGACIFFLLQECVGLILHGDLAAYVHSPYVDSHGETPQYRGRPLNLDLDRYNLLHEMWSGHTIRQKVVSERGSARQVIIADFY